MSDPLSDEWLVEEEGDDLQDDLCDHEEADIDIFTGRLSCTCGYSKWLSSDELEEEITMQARLYEEYHALCEKEETYERERR